MFFFFVQIAFRCTKSIKSHQINPLVVKKNIINMLVMIRFFLTLKKILRQ